MTNWMAGFFFGGRRLLGHHQSRRHRRLRRPSLVISVTDEILVDN
jgi:hypothetical protein